MRERWLGPVHGETAPFDQWVQEHTCKDLAPYGEVRGTFGGGVDRIIVFRPLDVPGGPGFDREAFDWDTGEVALLVRGNEPRGALQFPGESVWGLQVAGIVDLDADGIEEILWANQPLTDQLVTSAARLVLRERFAPRP